MATSLTFRALFGREGRTNLLTSYDPCACFGEVCGGVFDGAEALRFMKENIGSAASVERVPTHGVIRARWDDPEVIAAAEVLIDAEAEAAIG